MPLQSLFRCSVLAPFVLWYEYGLITFCQSHFSTHTPAHSHSIVYIKELMELHKDNEKPALHLREIEKPFYTQRLFIISSVPFSLLHASEEHFTLSIKNESLVREWKKQRQTFFSPLCNILTLQFYCNSDVWRTRSVTQMVIRHLNQHSLGNKNIDY